MLTLFSNHYTARNVTDHFYVTFHVKQKHGMQFGAYTLLRATLKAAHAEQKQHFPNPPNLHCLLTHIYAHNESRFMSISASVHYATLIF